MIDPKAVEEAVERLRAEIAPNDYHIVVIAVRRDDIGTVLTALEERTEALQQIKTVGTKTVSQRVGDMYAENGWQDFTTISEEAAIAVRALGGHND